jgi:hypothetical protein
LAFLESIFKKSNEIDIEEFLNTMDVEDESLYENADAYVKPIALQAEEDARLAVEEAKKGNLVLLNIGDLTKRNALKLRELVTNIKTQIEQIDGDIARISHDKVLITPSKVKIIKRRD